MVAFVAIVGTWVGLRLASEEPSARPAIADEAPVGAAQAALEEAAMAYGAAVREGDAEALRALLARRCGEADPAAIIDARRKLFGQETGIAIGKANVARPQVVHLDERAGIAHLFLGFTRGERRLYTRQLDGWALEDGQWKSIECPGSGG